MVEKTKLTFDEQRTIGELTDKLIEATGKSNTTRAEIFKRLSTFVEGVKLGLISKPEPAR